MLDAILAVLNVVRESSLFPLLQLAGFAVFFVLPFVALGMCVRADMRQDIRAALRYAGISEKEASLTIGISQGLLSRKLSGDKPLTFESLEALPAIFWQWLAVLMAHRHGTPAVIASASTLSAAKDRV